MFGYVNINKAELSKDETARYREFYCGLCESLNERHGVVGRATLSYDLTFLIILLRSLYEPELKEHTSRCHAHPTKKHGVIRCEMTDYAADMNIALAYYKAQDDWRDERGIKARASIKLLSKPFAKLADRYPRQLTAMDEELKKLSGMEQYEFYDLDACAGCFGELFGELFVYKRDEWSDTLKEIGASLGKFIYLMDAYDDIDTDERKGSFNPLTALKAQPGFDSRVKQILTLLMSECTSAFEALPLVEDVNILRNILYSGVWTRFAILERRKELKR